MHNRFGADEIFFLQTFHSKRAAHRSYMWPGRSRCLFGKSLISSHNLHRQTDSEAKWLFEQGQRYVPAEFT
jgi:hypothetical protein